MTVTDAILNRWAGVMLRLARPVWPDNDDDYGPWPAVDEEDCEGVVAPVCEVE